MENMYDLDIAIEILARMQTMKRNELNDVLDPLQKRKLQKETEILHTEEQALYSTNHSLQQSIIDKAFRIYGPLLKAKLEENYATI